MKIAMLVEPRQMDEWTDLGGIRGHAKLGHFYIEVRDLLGRLCLLGSKSVQLL
jgi:hypothetical protein